MATTTKRAIRATLLGGLFAASISLEGLGVLAEEVLDKPALLDVQVPAEAELEVDGHPTQSTGVERQFESPPLPSGRTFVYTLKATWRGRTVNRTVRLHAGGVVRIDLREQLQAPPVQAGSFRLLVPEAMVLTPGEKTILPLRVKRSHFAGPIRLAFEKAPQGVTLESVTFAENHTDVSASVLVAADTLPGSHLLTVRAKAGSLEDSAVIRITVLQPQPRHVEGAHTSPARDREPRAPDAKDRPSVVPTFQLELPDAIEVEAGRTSYVELRVRTAEGSALPGEPAVSLAVKPGSPVGWSPWAASPVKPGCVSQTIGVAFSARPDAAPGDYEVAVLANVGGQSVRRVMVARVKGRPPAPVMPARPIAALHLEPPTNLLLRPGQARYIEIRAHTDKGERLPGELIITFDGPALDGLSIAPWTISGRNSASAGEMGFAITASRAAALGDREVKVHAYAGPAKTERSFRVTIVPPEPKGERGTPSAPDKAP